jgi:LPXTG-motif cell wall-anchored protein
VAAGAYDVVLSEALLPAAGDAVTLPALRGPTGLWLVAGQASLGGQALAPDGVAVVRPGAGATLTSAGGGARVLALAVLPSGAAGAAGQLPRTGGGDTALLLVVGLGLALAVGGLAVGQRRPHP